ncbi:hypothetical protein PCL1606_14700 [Pseudomonas chlororaphis]|uniref:Uncharacterized protein n=1 Tax=Pseudomonas chlororaphis TaxID=587753 RepID=A0A0D5XVR0_9PSED|nr:hypothetical protein PCL1606_14700 [Pseudomonas chlororaphis]
MDGKNSLHLKRCPLSHFETFVPIRSQYLTDCPHFFAKHSKHTK